MTPSDDVRFAEDLRRFVLIAARLLEGMTTFKEISEAIELSQATISETVKRLEARYHAMLIHRTAGYGSKNSLSEEGQKLLRAFRSLGSAGALAPPDSAHVRSRVRLAVSKALFTTDLLFPDLPGFIRKYRSTAEVEVELADSFDFARAMAEVERGELGLAMAFRLTDGRDRRGLFPHLKFEQAFSPEFDVVVVGRPDKDWDPTPRALLARFATSRVVTVNRDLEPNDVRVIVPEGGWRRTVGSIDAVLAHVRCGLADFGVVPAIYPELDRHRQLGLLTYSRPIATAGLITVCRTATPSHVAEFAEKLRQFIARLKPVSDYTQSGTPLHVGRYFNRPAAGPDQEGTALPHEPEWYERLEWGYYVDHDRVGDPQAAGVGEPKWRWEAVWLHRTRPDAPPDAGPVLTLSGSVINAENTRFVCDAELRSNVFTVRAAQTDSTIRSRSVQDFQSVFVWCDRNAHVMYGTWRHFDPDGRPVTYSTVWSAHRLELDQLQAVAAFAARTIGLNANAEAKFEHCPAKRPVTPKDWKRVPEASPLPRKAK